MSTDGSKENAIWPMPQFYFQVKWGSTEINFSEISGLDNEAQIIEYRHGNSPVFYPIKMPGLGKVNNVTMKRGVFVGDNTFWEWFSKIKLNTVARVTVTISLLNEAGKPTMTWTLRNAWPTKITSTGMKSDDSSAAIDQLDVAFETMEIANQNNA
ncbi:phage tail protein [Rubritalea marina]|uniref:phage tail protein n=1 Tax=Rubritalea marina TaxID=361055 RepID=UPI00037CCEA8|nr:phage tail protein [Rubritalea marina]